MNLLNIYKKTMATIFSNPSVVMFFMLYMIASSFLGGFVFSAKNLLSAVLLLFSFFMFALCFVSGWLEVIKENSKSIGEDKNYWGIFLEGIGKNIIPLGLGFFIYLIFFVFVIVLAAKISHIAFGSLEFITKESISSIQNNQAFMEFFNSLTDNQKYILGAWQLLYIFATLTYSFLMLFYYPAIIFDEKTNVFLKPIIALKNSLCFLFKNFFGALVIHISIFTVYILFNYISARFAENAFISILLIFCYIYFISSAIMLIFNYYEQRNNCANGCDCIGENQNIDKSGEEN